ncbi:LacI family transcriptional regulator, partial [Streptomyces sp. NPDC048845]
VEEIGSTMASILLEEMDEADEADRPGGGRRQVLLPTSLVVRESS